MKIYAYSERCDLAGVRMRLRREQLKLSQEQPAAQLQLLGMETNQKAISRIETGARVVPDYELQFYAQALAQPLIGCLGRNKSSQKTFPFFVIIDEYQDQKH